MTAGLAGIQLESRRWPKSSTLESAVYGGYLDDPPPWIGCWGGEEQNPTSFAAGGGRNRRRRTLTFFPIFALVEMRVSGEIRG